MIKTMGLSLRTWMGLAVAFSLVSSTARASAIVYDTSGLVGTTGITGTNVIHFDPISHNSFSSPSTLSLGTFTVTALPGGQTTTYNHTPFAISFAIKTVDGINVAANPPLLTISGFLNGAITGAGKSTVIAVFNPIGNPEIVLGPDLVAFLSLPSPERTLVPSTTFGGQSTVEGFVSLSTQVSTPEPAAIAMFSVVAVGLGLRRFRAGR